MKIILADNLRNKEGNVWIEREWQPIDRCGRTGIRCWNFEEESGSVMKSLEHWTFYGHRRILFIKEAARRAGMTGPWTKGK